MSLVITVLTIKQRSYRYIYYVFAIKAEETRVIVIVSAMWRCGQQWCPDQGWWGECSATKWQYQRR